MGKVRLLPDHVANQIAAGEVIERPASVVKELVENSIDAGATRIEVEFRSGGTSLMRIEDNGSGMGRDDALLSLERHATSKIQKVKDLDGLATMGFRGEALPSIASVSRFQLQTRNSDSEAGTEVLIDGGKMLHVRDCGMPQGTRITISKLFNTVPARRKFLKSVTTEAAHIVHCVRLYALAHPEIGFSLLDDGRPLFQSPACASLKSRIAEIYGRQIANNLLEVDAAEEGMRMRGLVGKPSLSRSSRHEMLFFVNNRPVENKTLSYAVVESYHGHIPKGRYPVSFLFLDIAPQRVDVNVHPAKREIRFREEAKARGFAVRTLLETLRKETRSFNSIKPVELKATPPVSKSPEASKPATIQPRLPKEEHDSPRKQSPASRPRLISGNDITDTSKNTELGPQVRPKVSRSIDPEEESDSKPDIQRNSEVPTQSGSQSSKDRNWEYLGWAQGEFATFDTGTGVVLLSLRAARQRILYERLINEFSQNSIRCQKLLLAQPLELDPLAAAVMEEHQSFFEKLGFDISPFGRNFFRIEGIPTWTEDTASEELVKEILAALRQGSISGEKEDLAVEHIAQQAASRIRNVTKEPTRSEIDSLVESLFACEKPLTDHKGRPSLVEISSGEIDKRFQRKHRRTQEDLF